MGQMGEESSDLSIPVAVEDISEMLGLTEAGVEGLFETLMGMEFPADNVQYIANIPGTIVSKHDE